MMSFLVVGGSEVVVVGVVVVVMQSYSCQTQLRLNWVELML